MTATLPHGPSTPVGGPPRVRVDARPGSIYGYNVLDPATGVVHPCDYVGQARDPVRRDKQHRGQIPQRDGDIREQPWADLIVGAQRILEQGVWTDVEMDARELAWMGHYRCRINCRDNPNPDRVPIYVQRQLRDQRDAARGLQARDWSRPTPRAVDPTRTVLPVAGPPSLWSRFWATTAGQWLLVRLIRVAKVTGTLAAVWVAVWAIAWFGFHATVDDAAGWATGLLTVGLGAFGWRKVASPKKRRGRSRQRRTPTRRRTS